MAEDFNIVITFDCDNEQLEFIQNFDDLFQDPDEEEITDYLNSCKYELDTESIRSLVVKKYKNNLGVALGESAEECEPEFFAGQNYSLSELKRNNKGKYVISACGSLYLGNDFCRYLMVLLFSIGVKDLSAEAHAIGWDAKWLVDAGQLKMQKKANDDE